jgi:hypothetical protein
MSDRSRTEIERLKRAASITAAIGETLRLKRCGQLQYALCPFHAEKTPSFYVYPAHPAHYHCYGCDAHGDIFDWLEQARGMMFPEAVEYLRGAPLLRRQAQMAPRRTTQRDRAPTSHSYLRCWDQGIDPANTIVEQYLNNRGGLTVPESAPIRFHPRCQRGPSDLPGGPEFWPAMLALMTDAVTGQPVGLHRTFLRPDGSGKAPQTTRGGFVLKPKMILGNWGVIRLTPDDLIGRGLGIAEGIENALTASQIIGWGPVWATGTRGKLPTFPVLPWLDSVTVFADANDGGVGLRAARDCAARWTEAGREAWIHLPAAGEDWNDAVRRLAA